MYRVCIVTCLQRVCIGVCLYRVCIVLYRDCSMRVRVCIAFVSHLYRSCTRACVCVCLCYTGCLILLYPQRWIVSATQEDVRGNTLPGGSCFVFGAYSAAFSSVQSGSTVTGHGKRGKTIDGEYVCVCGVCRGFDGCIVV